MKISAVKAILTEQDIMSIIEDYVQVDGLEINSIEIREFITVRGSYKKFIKIPFEIKVRIERIKNNTVYVKIVKVNVSKLKIINAVKNIVLKKLLSDFENIGIKVDKSDVLVDLDKLSKLIPYFNFTLNKIRILHGALEAEVENVIYNENKKVEPIKKVTVQSPIRTEGEYSKVRSKLVGNIPKKYEEALQYAMFIPDITVMLWRLFRDKRVKLKVKMMVAGVIAYLVSPIDALPDFIPFVGEIDDIAIIFFGLNAIMNEIPEEIILENWQGEEEIILLTREAVNYISNVVGTYNVARLLEIIKNIFRKGHESYATVSKKQLVEVATDNIGLEEAAAVNEDNHNLH